MKCVLLVALVAVWISSGDATTCENIGECTKEMSQIGSSGGSGSQEDIERSCGVIRSAISCFKGALADCRNNPNFPKGTIDSLEQQMETYDSMLAQNCKDSGNNGAETMKMSALILVSILAIFKLLL